MAPFWNEGHSRPQHDTPCALACQETLPVDSRRSFLAAFWARRMDVKRLHFSEMAAISACLPLAADGVINHVNNHEERHQSPKKPDRDQEPIAAGVEPHQSRAPSQDKQDRPNDREQLDSKLFPRQTRLRFDPRGSTILTLLAFIRHRSAVYRSHGPSLSIMHKLHL